MQINNEALQFDRYICVWLFSHNLIQIQSELTALTDIGRCPLILRRLLMLCHKFSSVKCALDFFIHAFYTCNSVMYGWGAKEV